jgi:hypothetical protein
VCWCVCVHSRATQSALADDEAASALGTVLLRLRTADGSDVNAAATTTSTTSGTVGALAGKATRDRLLSQVGVTAGERARTDVPM